MRFIVAAVVGITLCGCCRDMVSVTSVRAVWDAVGPDYVEYVNKDASLDEAAKKTKLRTVELFDKTLAEASQP